MKKVMMILLLIGLLLFGSAAYGQPIEVPAAASLKISVNGVDKPVQDALDFYIIDNRTYVPLRYFSEALEADAGWHPARQVVYVGSEPIWTDMDLEPEADIDPLPIRFYYNGKRSTIPENLHIFTLDKDIYVPLRYLAEMLGYDVSWKQENGTGLIGISTGK